MTQQRRGGNRNGSIRLHRKHGLNPTIAICIYCGKDRGDIALLGAAYPGEAPFHMVIDLEPCDTCRANMARGIALIASDDGKRPSGRGYHVVTDDYAARLFPNHIDAIRKAGNRCFIDTEVFDRITLGPSISEENDTPQADRGFGT